jgi:alcohol dehydrogenase class IV
MPGGYHLEGRLNNFFSPSKIALGTGAVGTVGKEALALGAKRVLLVTDAGIMKTEIPERVKKALAAEHIDLLLYDNAQPETPEAVINEGGALAKREGCDTVIAFGGGTVLDTAKGISLMATNEGMILDYEGMDRVPRKGLSKIMVPTTAGSGSEITRVFAFTDQGAKKIVYTIHNLAEVVILDPTLTVSLPPLLTAETGLDALGHAVEAYTSTAATPFSDMLALEAIRLVGRSLLVAFAKGENIAARFDMILAATLAGLSFSSGGLGAIHALSFEMETLFKLSHARSVAILLPHVMDFNKIAVPVRLRAIAKALGESVEGRSDSEAAETAIGAVKYFLGAMGISSKLNDYGVTKDDIPKMAEAAQRQTRLFSQNARNVNLQDICEIFMKGME